MLFSYLNRFVAVITVSVFATFALPSQAQDAFPSECATNPTSATVIINSQASQSVVDAVSLSSGDPLVAVTPNENDCAGESSLDKDSNALLSVAQEDATTSTPGYQAGDPFIFWAQSGSGTIYELTPTFAPCGSDAPPLCEDSSTYQPDMVYEITDFSVTELPVELASWTATVNGARVILEWATASETQNAGFEVLLKQNTSEAAESSDWERLAFVDGAGTTTTPQTYRYATSALPKGEHFFRLRQVDVDGASTLSDPIQVKIGETRGFRMSPVSPHPVVQESRFQVTFDRSQDVTVALYNLLGQRVSVLHDGMVRANSTLPFKIDTRSLTSGRYLLQVTGPGYNQIQPVTVIR